MDGVSTFFHESDIFTHRFLLPDEAQAGILYVEDFDAPPEMPVEQPEPVAPPAPPPTYSLEEYTEACRTAHDAGVQSGLNEARHEQQAVQAQLRGAALSSIADALSMGGGDRAAMAQHMADELANTLLAMLLAALPAASATLAASEVSALLAVVLPPLRREPSLHIQVHPTLLDEITTDLAAFRAQHTGALTLTANENLPPPDVLVRWAEGEMRRDTGALWAELREALATFALPDQPPPATFPKGIHNGQ